jgi:hypothetical protein
VMLVAIAISSQPRGKDTRLGLNPCAGPAIW